MRDGRQIGLAKSATKAGGIAASYLDLPECRNRHSAIGAARAGPARPASQSGKDFIESPAIVLSRAGADAYSQGRANTAIPVKGCAAYLRALLPGLAPRVSVSSAASVLQNIAW